jgi:hypothetical protein
MGDGEAREYGLRICTDDFSVKEVVTLINVLYIRYDIQCSLYMKKSSTSLRKYPRIVIPSKQLKKLHKIVYPYFINEMLYKIKGV